MSLSTNFPTIRPSLSLDFAKSRTVDPRITFTRASTATYFDEDGVLQTAAVDRPRIDFNPSTLVCNGLLIEEQRTNLLLRSQEFGTNWIRFGTTTLTENTSVAPDGTTTGDNILFTSASAGIYQVVTGSASTTYTFSVWIKSSSSTQVRVVINTNLSDPTIQTVTATTSWQRFSISKTTSVGTTSVTAQIQDNGSGNTQFDIWGAQLEAGAFATSYIPTTTTALTRNADVATMMGTNFSSWYSASEGTIYTESQLTRQAAAALTLIATINDNTGNNFLHNFYRATGNTGFQCTVSTAGQADLNNGVAITANTVAKIGSAYKASDFAMSTNAGTVQTDTSGTIPTVSQLQIGAGASGNSLNGYIRRIAYYPARLVNAQLQALTL